MVASYDNQKIQVDRVSVLFPDSRIPTLKEWAVRTVRGHRPSLFAALQDISLEIGPREVLGIVGRNGAGKSTLLRVMAGVIPPSGGTATVTGHVIPLIELGIGFDPELSGAENIFFNGAFLGRSRSEMEARKAEIVRFSGLGQSIDSPLRTYSTGMVARLAFSIAVSAEADFFLLDEVLAVGDAEFQQRCEERLSTFHRRGTTIVIVSHDLGTLERVCTRVVWLEKGIVRMEGEPGEVLEVYRRFSDSIASESGDSNL